MGEFRYELPPDAKDSQWRSVSGEVQQALSEIALNQEVEPVFEEELEVLKERNEVLEWAEPELLDAFDSWSKYSSLLSAEIPNTLDDLVALHPKPEGISSRFEYIFEKRQLLQRSGQITPNGQNIGDTMHLVLVPWGEFLLQIEQRQLIGFISRMRHAQQIFSEEDDLGLKNHMFKLLQSKMPLYRAPQSFIIAPPGMKGVPINRHIREKSERLNTKAYLEKKIERDGPWGIMLVQTGGDIGTKSMAQLQASPYELWGVSKGRYTIEDTAVDNMGVLEWLALTYQEDPRTLKGKYGSWLLANYFRSRKYHIPKDTAYGIVRDDHVETADFAAGSQTVFHQEMQARLAL